MGLAEGHCNCVRHRMHLINPSLYWRTSYCKERATRTGRTIIYFNCDFEDNIILHQMENFHLMNMLTYIFFISFYIVNSFSFDQWEFSIILIMVSNSCVASVSVSLLYTTNSLLKLLDKNFRLLYICEVMTLQEFIFGSFLN